MGKIIKFFDIYQQDKKIHKEFLFSLNKIFKSSDFILGAAVNKFENNFSKFCSINYSVSCANGTDALYLALKALNLPRNSEVIVPAMTWISTVLSVINCGLKPILVDVNKDDALISNNKIKEKISSKTKVILPVHLYGSVVDIKSIKNLIKTKKIKIIEDGAQAHGALDSNKFNLGKFSDMCCFSFYPGKNLGCYGDGGLIITNNKNYYLKLKKLRNLGQETKNIHNEIGVNSRLDTIQAKLLDIKLKNLKKLNLKRQRIASFYNKNIKNKKIKKINYSRFAVYHQYVILVNNRKKLINLLNKNNIQTGIHYPLPINKLDCFKKIFKNQRFPNAEYIAKNCLSLPIDPNLKIHELKKICKVLNQF